MNTPTHNDFAPVTPDGERFLRIKQAAALFSMSDKTVRRMIEAGQLPSVKLRGLRLIRWSDLKNLLKSSV